MKYKVLSTKKLDTSLVEQAEQNDIEVIEQEFISVKTVFSEDNQEKISELLRSGVQNFVFTSANAVSSLHSYEISFPTGERIFCLSGKTKEEVLKFGFLEKNIAGEAENASELAKKIIEQKIGVVIFFCGNKRRDELPSLLKDAGITVHEIIVYETSERPAEVDDNLDAVLFFSPSAVQSFFRNNKLNEQTVLFAIGETTAKEIKDCSINKIIIGDEPQQKALLEKVISYFQTHPIHH